MTVAEVDPGTEPAVVDVVEPDPSDEGCGEALWLS